MDNFLIKIDRKYKEEEAKQILKNIMKYFKATGYSECSLGLLLIGVGFLRDGCDYSIFGWTYRLGATPATTHDISQFRSKQQLKYNKDLK